MFDKFVITEQQAVHKIIYQNSRIPATADQQLLSKAIGIL